MRSFKDLPTYIRGVDIWIKFFSQLPIWMNVVSEVSQGVAKFLKVLPNDTLITCNHNHFI